MKKTRKGNREKLMNAALQLVAEDHSDLSGISLRRLTKACDLSPPAFYSHFASMEALGLALIEEVGGLIRELLSAVRHRSQDTASEKKVIENSIAAAFAYIQSQPEIFILVCRERAGSSRRIREAIRREVSETVEEMANDFTRLAQFKDFSFIEMRSLVGAILGLAINLIPDYLDLAKDSPRAAQELLREFEFQVKLIARQPQPV